MNLIEKVFLVIILFFCYQSIYATDVDTSFMKAFNAQLNQLYAFNESNNINGESNKNQYVFIYKHGKTFRENLLNDKYFFYEQNEVGKSDIIRLPLNLREELNTALKDFNQDIVVNPNKVQIYSILIHGFKAFVKSKLVDGINNTSSVLEHLKKEIENNPNTSSPNDTTVYKNYLDTYDTAAQHYFNEKLGNIQERVILFGAVHIYKKGKTKGGSKEYKYVRHTYSEHLRGPLVSGHGIPFKRYYKKKYANRECNNCGAPYEDRIFIKRNFNNRVISAIEYFSDPAFLEECSKYSRRFETKEVQDYIEELCTDIEVSPTFRTRTLRIASLMDTLVANGNTDLIKNNDYDLAGSINDFLQFEKGLTQYDNYQKWILNKIDKAIEESDRNALNTVYHAYVYSQLYELLSVEQRLASLELLCQGNMYGNSLFGGKQEEFAVNIIHNTPDDQVNELVNKLSINKDLIVCLYNKIDDIGGADNFTGLAKAYVKLSNRFHGIVDKPIKTDYNKAQEHLIWNFPTYRKEEDTYSYQDSEFKILDGKPTISIEYSICQEQTVDEVTVGQNTTKSIRCTAKQYVKSNFSPFALVSIDDYENLSFLEGVKGETKLIPAIALAYMIDKKDNEEDYKKAMLALEVGTFALGVGELNAAIKAGNTTRKVIAGWALVSDVAAIGIQSESFKNWCVEKYGQEVYDKLLLITTINLAAAGSVSLADAAMSWAVAKKVSEGAKASGKIDEANKLDEFIADSERHLKNTEGGIDAMTDNLKIAEALIEYKGFRQAIKSANDKITDVTKRLTKAQMDELTQEAGDLFKAKNWDESLLTDELVELIVKAKAKGGNPSILTRLDGWDKTMLEKLINKLSRPADYVNFLEDMLDPIIFVAVERILRVPENAHDIIKNLKSSNLSTAAVERLAKSSFFQEFMKKGKDFEDFIVDGLVDKTLTARLGELIGKNLDDYEVFTQVQLKYKTTVDNKDVENFFIADQVLVKYNDLGKIEDVIILENKLSKGTSLTPPQNGGVKNLTDKKGFEVRSADKTGVIDDSNFLKKSDKLEIDKISGFHKVFSDGNGGNIQNIETKFKK